MHKARIFLRGLFGIVALSLVAYVAVMQITLVNIIATSTTEEVVTKFNALLADFKAKDYMEADSAQ